MDGAASTPPALKRDGTFVKRSDGGSNFDFDELVALCRPT
jgi:hypothetical protein